MNTIGTFTRVLGLLLWSLPLVAGDLTTRFDVTHNRLLTGRPPTFDTALVPVGGDERVVVINVPWYMK